MVNGDPGLRLSRRIAYPLTKTVELKEKRSVSPHSGPMTPSAQASPIVLSAEELGAVRGRRSFGGNVPHPCSSKAALNEDD